MKYLLRISTIVLVFTFAPFAHAAEPIGAQELSAQSEAFAKRVSVGVKKILDQRIQILTNEMTNSKPTTTRARDIANELKSLDQAKIDLTNKLARLYRTPGLPTESNDMLIRISSDIERIQMLAHERQKLIAMGNATIDDSGNVGGVYRRLYEIDEDPNDSRLKTIEGIEKEIIEIASIDFVILDQARENAKRVGFRHFRSEKARIGKLYASVIGLFENALGQEFTKNLAMLAMTDIREELTACNRMLLDKLPTTVQKQLEAPRAGFGIDQ